MPPARHISHFTRTPLGARKGRRARAGTWTVDGQSMQRCARYFSSTSSATPALQRERYRFAAHARICQPTVSARQRVPAAASPSRARRRAQSRFFSQASPSRHYMRRDARYQYADNLIQRILHARKVGFIYISHRRQRGNATTPPEEAHRRRGFRRGFRQHYR